MASSLVEYGDSEYPIVVSEVNDVLDSIEFNSFEERCLCEAIITEMDKAIADTISDEKVANIPFIGCVRRNPIRKAINDNKEKLKVIRKGITKEQYKDHVRCILNDAREKVEKELLEIKIRKDMSDILLIMEGLMRKLLLRLLRG